MPRKKAIALTRLESETMRAVWDAEPDAVSVRDVLDSINKGRRKRLAYNTIQTVMTILKEKGFVKQVSSQGRAHQFVACITRQEAGKHLFGDLAKRLFGNQMQPMIQHMIDDAQLTPQQLQELRDWVDDKLTDAQE